MVGPTPSSVPPPRSNRLRAIVATSLSGHGLRSATVVVIALIVAGVTYWRLYNGVDTTDESYYVATTYRLVLGARPFVDETTISQQTAAILLYPFVWAYYELAGLTGIVLFLRHLHFLFSLAVALAIFVSLRPIFGVRRAVLVALTAVAFVPLDIHNLSYITLGSGLFAAGCFLGLPSLRRPGEGHGSRLLAGVAHGLAAFAYPPLILPVAGTFVVRHILARGRARNEVLGYGLLALGLPIVAMASLFASAGPHHAYTDYRRASDYFDQGGGIDKLAHVAWDEKSAVLLLPGVVLLAVAWRWRRDLVAPVLLTLPFFALPPHFYTLYPASSLDYVAHYGWLALPLFFFVRKRADARLLLFAVWIPALLAGVTTGYSSDNSSIAIGIGFFPATIVGTTFLVWAVQQAAPETLRGQRDLRWAAAAPALTVLTILLVLEAIPVYRDGPISALSARIRNGPYAGLLTTPQRRADLALLQLDLATVESSCTILFYNGFPAGYLLSRARPDTNSAWTFGDLPAAKLVPYREDLVRYYRLYGFPDVVVMLRETPQPAVAAAVARRVGNHEPLVDALRARSYSVVRSRSNYVVYRDPSSTCASPSSSDRITSPSWAPAVRRTD